MSAIPPLITYPSASQNKVPNNNEQSSVQKAAFEILSKLPFVYHELDEYGFFPIQKVLKLKNSEESEKILTDYLLKIYLKNGEAKSQLMSDGLNNINSALKIIGVYNAKVVLEQPLSFIDKISMLKKPIPALLLRNDPRFALSILTAKNCGLNTQDEFIKRGALCIIAINAKHLEHRIFTAKEISKETLEALESLSSTTHLLYQLKEKERDPEILKILHPLAEEVDLIENNAYKHCKNLKSAFSN